MIETSTRKINVNYSDLKDYLFGRVPFARAVHDKSAIPLLSEMVGTVIEIGASNRDYSQYASNCKKYIKTNLVKLNDQIVVMNATTMNYENDSIDGFVCLSVLEHIYDYQKVIDEVYRCLKPGGKFLLITPWVFPFHGAPNDYFRFSSSALTEMTDSFSDVYIESVGGYWINMAFLLQKPLWNNGGNVLPFSLGAFVRRLIGFIFLLVSKFKKNLDDDYVMLYAMVVIK